MKVLYCFIIGLGLVIPDLSASVSQGKEVHARVCLACHPYVQNMAGKKTSQEWKRIFKYQDGTNELAKTHLAQEEAKKSWRYFTSEEYMQEMKHLRDLMLKYSSDRAGHNSCF